MRSNKLQPNPDKTELLWCSTTQRQHQPPTSSLLIDGCSITPVQSARWPRHLRRLRPVDADTRPTYRVAMLRRATSTTSDPSPCAVGHTSDARGCTGALPAGLWERRAGRPSGLPDALTPLGPEHDSSTDLPPDDLWPHIWCSHQSALAAGSGWSHYKLAVFWRARFCMAMHHVTSVRWPVSTTCLVDEYSVLPMPTASWYHPSNCQQSAAEPLRLRLHLSGIHCQLTSLGQIYHLLSTAKRFLFKKSYSDINWSFVKNKY